MKKRIIISAVLVLALLVSQIFSVASALAVDTIPDPESPSAGIVDDNLRQALINAGADYYSDGVLTQAEIGYLTGAVDLSYMMISDITGLEYLINASSLSLSSNSLSDISPISGLTQLSELRLGNTGISDLSALSGLTNLTTLNLECNGIIDISPLNQMGNMNVLLLTDNHITDISPLAGLTNVFYLRLGSNNIETIDVFQGWSRFDNLELDNNKITSISPLTQVDSIGNLNIKNNNIDINDPVEMGYINSLNIEGDLQYEQQNVTPDPDSITAGISDANLKQALIDGGFDIDLNGDLSQDELRQYYGSVNLNNKGITDLEGMQYFENAESINVANNDISDLSPLAGLTNLLTLYVQNNDISDLTPVSGLANLIYLYAFGNDILSVEPLRDSGLMLLHLSDNEISDISPLATMPNLLILCVSDNEILDISPAVSIESLWYIVRIENNYLDLSDGSDDMPYVQALIDRCLILSYAPQKTSTLPPSEENPGDIEVASSVVTVNTSDGATSAEISNEMSEEIVNSVAEYAAQIRDEATASGEEAPDVDIILPSISTEDGANDVSIALGVEAMQTASDYDIGLVIKSNDVILNIPSSVLDTSGVPNIDSQGSITFEQNNADDQVITEPVFQVGEGGEVLSGAIELNIIVDTLEGVTEITQFSEPIEVSIQLTQEFVDSVTDPCNLTIYWYDPSTGNTEAIDTLFNPETLELAFWTNHFSTFIIVDKDTEAPTIQIINPLEDYSTLQVGNAVEFAISDNICSVDECTVTAILDNGITEETIETGFVPEVGVYTLTIQAEDKAGNMSIETREFVIYNPEGSFITGGGWYDSKAGTYSGDNSIYGKATFGFVAKYKSGTVIPTGQTTFKFKEADLEFNSASYDWLINIGDKAILKGSGTINGQGDYSFLIVAVDDNSGSDSFRIKIWDGETVIYDNSSGISDYLNIGDILGGGSIQVHK